MRPAGAQASVVEPRDSGWPVLTVLYSESIVVEGFRWFDSTPLGGILPLWEIEAGISFLHDVVVHDVSSGYHCDASQFEGECDSRFIGNSFLYLSSWGHMLLFNIDPPYN